MAKSMKFPWHQSSSRLAEKDTMLRFQPSYTIMICMVVRSRSGKKQNELFYEIGSENNSSIIAVGCAIISSALLPEPAIE
jgi:hypothetical protein